MVGRIEPYLVTAPVYESHPEAGGIEVAPPEFASFPDPSADGGDISKSPIRRVELTGVSQIPDQSPGNEYLDASGRAGLVPDPKVRGH